MLLTVAGMSNTDDVNKTFSDTG